MSDKVLPASAGMINPAYHHQRTGRSAPRICGDDPAYQADSIIIGKCSPHLRG